MGSEGKAGKLAIERVQTMSLQSFRVQGIRWCILLECKQLAVEVNDVCVGGGTYLELDGVRVLVPILA